MTVSITLERQRLAALRGRRQLRRREQWNSTYPYSTPQPTSDPWPGRNRLVDEPANRVFVHISVTEARNFASNDAHIRHIEAIGRSRFPNTGVSYNRGTTPDATGYELQPMGRRGAHTVNDFKRATCTTAGCPSRGRTLTAPGRDWNLNYNARAYVIAQNVGDPVSTAQLHEVAQQIAADMLAGLVTRDAPIHGHRCVASKSCPAGPMWARMGELEDLVARYLSVGFDQEEDDLVTTQAEFNVLMNTWCQSAAVATRAYMDAVNKAVLAGTAMPVLPNPSLQRAGIQLGAMVALWPVVGRHKVKTATTPGVVAPNTHLIFGEMHSLFAQFAEGGRLDLLLDRILAESIDDLDLTLSAEEREQLAASLSAKLVLPPVEFPTYILEPVDDDAPDQPVG
jgi:hypothetical protein